MNRRFDLPGGQRQRVALASARARRYDDRDQQDRSPGDPGFQFVDSLQDTTISCGKGL